MRRLFALLLLCLLPAQALAAGTVVYSGGTGTAQSPFNLVISNTAPSLTLTDTTASAKSLTIAVDANLAQWRESAGASLSGMVYDLANDRLGLGTTPLRKLDVAGGGRFTGMATSVLTGSIDAIASTTVTGVGTLFLTELVVGDRITITGETRTVTAIASDTSLTVDTATTNTANDTSVDKLNAIFITRLSSGAIGMVQNDLGYVGIGKVPGAIPLDIVSAGSSGDIAKFNTTSNKPLYVWGDAGGTAFGSNPQATGTSAAYVYLTPTVMQLSAATYLGLAVAGVDTLRVTSTGLDHVGANGQKWTLGRKTELTTIAAAATTTTTITIPADAILEAVLMRVTTVIPTAATMVVTATTSGTILQQGASIAVAAGTTDIGTRANGTNYGGVAAQTITITPNATPANDTGRVRFDIYYKVPTVATS